MTEGHSSRGRNTLPRGATLLKLFLILSEKGSSLKGANSFLLNLNLFSEQALCTGKQTGSEKRISIVKMEDIVLSVSSPLAVINKQHRHIC